jgi:hypothetical protein
MYSIILLHEVQLGLGAIAKLSGGVTQGGETWRRIDRHLLWHSRQ